MYFYTGRFADTELSFCFKYQGTAEYYGNTLKACVERPDMIEVQEKDVREWMERWNQSDLSYAEYVQSCSYACDYLMKEGKAVFHGAALLWKEKAYIFTAPPGTGKTTQVRLWRELFSDEAEILNGDKPILEACMDGNIMVHPSPWKGKEGLGRDDIKAPLGGIILLRQASYNRIRRMEVSEAVKNLFGRNYSTFNSKEEVLAAAGILEKILYCVPVWMLENLGDANSVLITHRALMKELKKEET